MLYTSVMARRKKERPLYQRVSIDIAGFGLMIIAPFLGWLPGPGGVPLFLAGLYLVSLNHDWAENLLKDFEKKRVEWTNKYLMPSPRVSLAVDLISLVLLCIGVYLAVTQDNLLYRGSGLILVGFMIILLISNQKRFERIGKWFKKRKKT